MKVAHYSYDKIYKALPAKYQKEEFIYTYNGIPFMCEYRKFRVG